MVLLTYNPNILSKIACFGGLVAVPRTMILITQRSLYGGAVLRLILLFSSENQNKGSHKSERSQVFSGLKSDSSGVLWIYRVQTRT